MARHARASRAEITVTASVGELHLEIVDDGIGPGGPGRPAAGKGLPNMAERAELLGGSFALSARPQGGTRVEWRVPLT